jgi:hypothetical protein
MLSEFFETFNIILKVDVFTISVVGVLSAWAGIIIRHMTDSTALAAIFMPAIYLGALVGIWGFRELDIVFSFDKDSNTIISACGGMIVAMLFMLIAVRACYYVFGVSHTGLENQIRATGTSTIPRR